MDMDTGFPVKEINILDSLPTMSNMAGDCTNGEVEKNTKDILRMAIKQKRKRKTSQFLTITAEVQEDLLLIFNP